VRTTGGSTGANVELFKAVEIKSKGKVFTIWNLRVIMYRERNWMKYCKREHKNYLY
jgi:hypothetical protein